MWLGKGLLAVSGADYYGDEQAGQPVGLRVVDTRDWRMRILDRTVVYISRTPNNQAFLATTPFTGDLQHISVYGMDATLRYRFEQTLGVRMLNVQGPYAYVCKKSRVLRILDADNGNTLRVLAVPRPACPTGLLYAQLLSRDPFLEARQAGSQSRFGGSATRVLRQEPAERNRGYARAKTRLRRAP